MLPNKELITANIKTEDVITNTSKTTSDAGESQEIFRDIYKYSGMKRNL